MTFLHDLDLRMQYTLQTLQQILVLILQFSSKSHKVVTVDDPDVALVEIIKSKYDVFEKVDQFKLPHYKNRFYDDFSKKKRWDSGFHRNQLS